MFILLACVGIIVASLLFKIDVKEDIDVSSLPPAQSSQSVQRSSSPASSVLSSSVSQESSSSSQSSSQAPPPASSAAPVSSVAPSSVAAASSYATFEISTNSTHPGEFFTLYAYDVEDPSKITVDNPFGVTPQWFKTENYYTAFFPVKYTFTPAEYNLTFIYGDRKEEFTIYLLDKNFPTQNLVVDSSVTSNTIENDDANNEYNVKVQPLKFLSQTSPIWEDAFLMPVQGEITTEFGTIRTVNGSPSDRHGGIDIAASRGTPIVASNSGVVLFAQYIQLTGNTVCIEHGYGLKTWYYHMDSLSVKDNERVEKGQQIGTVGSTGFSTGPHLHFAASIFSTYVNPWTLMDASPEI